jgi:hypothetical protein
MRKIALMIVFSLIFFSCEKNSLVPENEIPDWLKTRISQDELKIQENPKYMTSWGAWIRYKWQNEYYFEYHNVVSSSSPRAISTKGDTLKIWANDINTDYYKEKCCKAFVWKAPKYREY